MRKFILFSLIVGIGISGILLTAQKEQDQPKYYIQATLYPTYSLSRYDYNNDIDRIEIRAYIELRRESVYGDTINNAAVTVNNENLEFKESHYEKRIDVPKHDLPDEIHLKIEIPEELELKRTYAVPDWLVIKNPQPSIINPSQPLSITWEFKRCPGPVKVDAYNFNSGESLLSVDNFKKNQIVIPEEKIPKQSLLRIYVMHTWIYKQYIRDRQIVRGSELNVMPWSQVFIRTK